MVDPAPAPAPSSPDPAPAPSTDWTAALDPDLRGLVQTKGWKGPADAIKSYTNLEKTLGADKIPIPGKDAKPEDWDTVYNKLGRPESADKYDLGDFKPPEGLPWSADVQSAMLKEMHAAGLSNKQARHILAKYAEMQGAQWTEINGKLAQSVEAATVALKKEWGSAYDAKVDVANRAFKFAAGDQLEAFRQIKLADGTYLGDNPIVVRAFAKLGEAMGEDTLKGQGGRRMSLTPEEAKAEIARMEGDKETAAKMADKNHPEYAALNAKRNALYNAAYPES